jgi:acyl carrier protein
VREIIAHQLELPAERVTLEARFGEDLKADPLAMFELVMALEDDFKIEIPEEDIELIRTVQDAVDYLRAHTGAS